jgi:hypothetical protein
VETFFYYIGHPRREPPVVPLTDADKITSVEARQLLMFLHPQHAHRPLPPAKVDNPAGVTKEREMDLAVILAVQNEVRQYLDLDLFFHTSIVSQAIVYFEREQKAMAERRHLLQPSEENRARMKRAGVLLESQCLRLNLDEPSDEPTQLPVYRDVDTAIQECFPYLVREECSKLRRLLKRDDVRTTRNLFINGEKQAICLVLGAEYAPEPVPVEF